jgi:hypothetical protein
VRRDSLVRPLTLLLLSACGSSGKIAAEDAGSGEASAQVPIGASCTPTDERSSTFAGFSVADIEVEVNNPTCAAGVCLINHFQGLTDCPYGQDSSGNPIPPATMACTVPGTGQPVAPQSPQTGDAIEPWCTDRQPSATVYCSCRCANAQGETDDGATYCTCPGSFTCTQLIPAGLGSSAGAYCVEDATEYDPSNACAVTCNPSSYPCQ